MKLTILFIFLISLSLHSLAQTTSPQKGTTFGEASENAIPPSSALTAKTKFKKNQMHVGVHLGSFQENMITLVNNQAYNSKANFITQSVWINYEKAFSRVNYGLSGRLHFGQVDIEKVQGITYPRTQWTGIELVPDFVYRINANNEFVTSLHLLQKNIQGLSTTYSYGFSAGYRIRLISSLFLEQSVGSYGEGNSPLYYIGLNFVLF